MKIKLNDGKAVLRAATKKYRDALRKIINLETSLDEGEDSEVTKFRREFFPSLSGFKFDPSKDESGRVKGHIERDQWFMELTQNKAKHERYQQRLRDLAVRFSFDTPEEKSILEEYLQTGDPIVSGNLLKSKTESDKWQPTRVWETASLARRLKQMRKKGKSYKEIAAYYNKIKPANARTVTTSKLRQIVSRAKKY